MNAHEEVVEVVVVHEDATTRTYYVNVDFDCAMENLIADEALKAQMESGEVAVEFNGLPPDMPDEFKRAIVMQMHGHRCSLGVALEQLGEFMVETRHKPDRVEVAINPARTSWAVVNSRVIAIIDAQLGGNGVEVSELHRSPCTCSERRK